jgi:hypothetical protein
VEGGEAQGAQSGGAGGEGGVLVDVNAWWTWGGGGEGVEAAVIGAHTKQHGVHSATCGLHAPAALAYLQQLARVRLQALAHL